MKFSLAFLVTVFFVAGLHAQTHFNTTFFPPGGDAQWSSKGQKVVILPRQNLGSENDDYVIFSSNNLDDHQNCTGVELVATDKNGTYLRSVTIQYGIDQHHITKTRDGGVLFAGYSSQINNYLYVIKFNENLGTIWQRRFPIIPKNIRGPYESVDIEPVFDNKDQVEHFYISFSEGNIIPLQENFPTQGIVKIDQNGSLKWHRFYQRSMFQNEARAITSYIPPGKTEPLIALASTGRPIFMFDPPQYSFPRICLMTIDPNGNIVTQMRGWWPLSDLERMPDIVWDDYNQKFVVVFTSMSGALTLPVSSSICLAKLDETYDNVYASGLYAWKYTGAVWGVENYGVSITKDNAGDYVIGGWTKVVEGVPGQPPYFQFMEAPHIFNVLKTDPLTGPLTTHTLRPVKDARQTGHVLKYINQFHVTDHLNNTVLVPSIFWTATAKNNPRLIRTNNALQNCHDWPAQLMYKPPVWNHDIYGHAEIPFDEISENALPVRPSNLLQIFCSTNPAYRLAEMTPVENQGTIKLYPNLVTDMDQDISFDVRDNATVTKQQLDIFVINMLGQLIYKETYYNDGISIKKIAIDRFSKGVNMIHVSCKGVIIFTGKVAKM